MVENDIVFTIYGKENCPHCVRAKEFARKKYLNFRYLTLDLDYSKEDLVWLCSKHNYVARTVPQVFVESGNGICHLGGADDFIEFIEKGI